MKNIIGIVVFFVSGIILGGCILQLNLGASVFTGAICYSIYQALVAQNMAPPILLWMFLIGCKIFAWMMF